MLPGEKGNLLPGKFNFCDILEGTILVLNPGEWHTYRPDETTGWECYWVGFSGSVTENLNVANPIIQVGYDEEIVGLYRKMLEVSNSERPRLSAVIVGHFDSFAGLFVFTAKRTKNWRDKEVLTKIDKARLIIREKIKQSAFSGRNCSFAEHELYLVSPDVQTIHRTGSGTIHYTIENSKSQGVAFRLTGMSVKEVALELGYESIDYFSTLFKKQTGMTPGEFRNNGRKDLK